MDKLLISPAPHLHSKDSTRRIMRDVIIALMPAVLVSVYFAGLSALLVIVVSVTGCVLVEHLIVRYLMKKKSTVHDLSAVVTGLILALNLPVSSPWWMVLTGCMLSEKKIKEITLLKHPEHWKPILGQEVFIEMRTRLGFRALWLGMVLPAIVLGIITALCVWSGMAEWLLGLIVLSGMGIYYFVLYLLKDHIRNDFYFTVHNIEP